MTTFTRITNGQSIDAATFNNPMTQLEAAIEGGLNEIVSDEILSDVGSVIISSVPTTYRDLVLVLRTRNSTTSPLALFVKPNNDSTASNYYSTAYIFQHSASFTTSERLGISASFLLHTASVASSEPSGICSTNVMEFMNYQDTSKSTVVRWSGFTPSSTTGTSTFINGGGYFLPTTAITSIVLTANIAAGSSYTLFGRGNGV